MYFRYILAIFFIFCELIESIVAESKENYDSSLLCTNREAQSRKYLNREIFIGDTHYPPLLISFPGSGNTWMRLLIEYSTGIYSGSIYADKSLFEIMPGEPFCDSSVGVVKVHINTSLNPYNQIIKLII